MSIEITGQKTFGGAAGASALSAITAATGTATIANGNNPILWNWAQTTDAQDGLAFGETSAATGGTLTGVLANQALISISTAAASTSTPLEIVQGSITGTVAFPALQIETTWNNAALVGEGIVLNVTNTASAVESNLINLAVGGTSVFRYGPSGGAPYTALNLGQIGGGSVLIQATSGILYINVHNSLYLIDIGGTGNSTVFGAAAKLTQYAGISTVSNGIPTEFATVDLTAQAAAITATTIYAVPSTGAGQYRISFNAKITTADGTSSVLGGTNGFQIVYTDKDDSVVVTTAAAVTFGTTTTLLTGNTTQTQMNGCIVVNAKASTNIQYVMGYTGVGGQMRYNLHIKVEAM